MVIGIVFSEVWRGPGYPYQRVWILNLCKYLSCHITVFLYVCYLPSSSTSYSCPHYNITNHCSSRTRLWRQMITIKYSPHHSKYISYKTLGGNSSLIHMSYYRHHPFVLVLALKSVITDVAGKSPPSHPTLYNH